MDSPVEPTIYQLQIFDTTMGDAHMLWKRLEIRAAQDLLYSLPSWLIGLELGYESTSVLVSHTTVTGACRQKHTQSEQALEPFVTQP